MGADYNSGDLVWERQDDIVFTQANPTSGLEYDVLVTLAPTRILFCNAQVTWTVQPGTIEVWMYLDGFTQRFFRANPLTGTNYTASYETEMNADQQMDAWVQGALANRAFLDECRRATITFETTGGTVSSLDGRIKYALMVPK